ncbi:thioredoxin domain-containing protein [Croceicoccus sp. Ery5]|uniref:thioredoxin domain-containing protein n=1 Tax=Croceicoccus sp. Ery5 TaxID=1703340 RepID=UPI001E582D4F|nr:thioredoxin domain-containing protein [Croceicoccus sp. Ery5]
MIKARFNRPLLALALAPLAMLAACNSAEEATVGSVESDPVEAVPAPEGQSWSQIVVPTEQGGYLMGNPDAPIKFVEYGALSCSHCADFAETAGEELRSEYVDSGRVSFELRFVMLNAMDVPAALLAQCSAPEATIALADQFWANQAMFFQNAQQAGDGAFQQVSALPPEQRLVAMAQLFGMTDFFAARGVSRDQANACLTDLDAAQKFVETSNGYEVTSTPTLEINGTRLTGAPTWEELEPALQRAGAR